MWMLKKDYFWNKIFVGLLFGYTLSCLNPKQLSCFEQKQQVEQIITKESKLEKMV
jgi:hypothetical protein